MCSVTHTFRLFIVLLVLNLSCQTKPKQEANDRAVVEQVERATDLTKRPGPDAPRSAADRLVRALYFEHDAKENPFLETQNPTLSEQFFTKSTAALILKKASKTQSKRKQINPLFNVPDSAIEKRWVLPAAVAGQKAVVFVTYHTAGKEQEMRCEMDQQPNGRWRIADIVYADGQRLTNLLK